MKKISIVFLLLILSACLVINIYSADLIDDIKLRTYLPVYEYIRNSNSDYAVAYKNGIYHLIDSQNHTIYSSPADDMGDFSEGIFWTCDLDTSTITFSELNGNSFSLEGYDRAEEFKGGKCVITDDEGKYGIINTSGNFIIECQYEDIIYNTSDTVLLTMGDGWYRVDINDDITQQLSTATKIYDPIMNDEYKHIVCSNDKKFGIIDYAGNIIVDFKYDSVKYVGNGLYVGYSGSYSIDLMDVNGNVTASIPAYYVGEFADGLMSVYDKNGFCYVDFNGNTVFRVEDTDVVDCDAFYESLAVVRTSNNGYTYLNKNGEIVIGDYWDFAGRFADGYALVMNYITDVDNDVSQRWHIIDTDFNVVLTLDYDVYIDPSHPASTDFSDGYIRTIDRETGLMGFIRLVESGTSCAHSNKVTTPAKSPTCTEPGNNLYYTCSDCGDVLDSKGESTTVEIETLPAKGHSVVIDISVPATCTSQGKTEGKHCSVCDEVIIAQTVIPMKGHSYGDWVIVIPPTASEEGKKQRTCSGCTAIETEFIPPEGGTTDNKCGDNAYWIYNDSMKTLTIYGTGEIWDYSDDLVPPWYEYNNAITKIVIEPGITSTGVYSFAWCKMVTDVSIPDSISSIAAASFFDCRSLTNVNISDKVNVIGMGAFAGCDKLKSISVDTNNQYFSNDEYGALFNKNQTNLIQIPGGFIGDYIIPDGVKAIGNYACSWCYSMTSITIPISVVSIGNYSFYSCNELTNVYYEGSLSQWNSIPKGEFNDSLSTAILVSMTHIHRYAPAVIAPTCTEKGYITYTCNCGDSYIDDYVDSTGHTEVIDSAVPSTCTTTGLTEGTHCSVCSEILTVQQTTDALDHDFSPEWTVDVEPTTTTLGQKSRHCSRCDEVTDVIEIAKKVEIIDTSKKFNDVSATSWAKPGIDYVVSFGYMNGTGNGSTFSPSGTMSRSMIVTVLYRIAGQPSHSGNDPFTDISTGWYYDAVLWAYENGIVTGTSKTTFAPDGAVTREQMATFLYRFAKYMGYDVSKTNNISTFPDASKVGSWAYDALAWANAEGLITGAKVSDGVTRLDPQGNATREQVATILMRFGKAFE